jgi:hypothetical protein
LKAAVDRSSELDVYTDASKHAKDMLAKLDSTAFADHGEVATEFKQVSYGKDL